MTTLSWMIRGPIHNVGDELLTSTSNALIRIAVGGSIDPSEGGRHSLAANMSEIQSRFKRHFAIPL